MSDCQKILIANRGEIANFVVRAANKLGKQTAYVYGNESKVSLHLFKANESFKSEMDWAQ